MAHAHLALAHSLPSRHASGTPWPFRIAVPVILLLSAALWAGIWELGRLLVGLLG